MSRVALMRAGLIIHAEMESGFIFPLRRVAGRTLTPGLRGRRRTVLPSNYFSPWRSRPLSASVRWRSVREREGERGTGRGRDGARGARILFILLLQTLNTIHSFENLPRCSGLSPSLSLSLSLPPSLSLSLSLSHRTPPHMFYYLRIENAEGYVLITVYLFIYLYAC